MSKKLSQMYLEKNILSVRPISHCVVLSVAKTYGEIIELETRHETAKGLTLKDIIEFTLQEIAQREGIKDFNI